MTIEIAIRLSGFLFLFILVQLVTSVALRKTIGDFDSVEKLKEIDKNPKKFQMSVVLGLIEYVRVIALAIMLFIAFSSYNIILGVVWATCRTVEGLILIYNEINYWGLLKLARQYAGTGGAEKKELSDSGRIILQTRSARWTLATTLFGIGTLAYSILFVAHGVVPALIGWLGLVAGILLVFDSGIKLVKPASKAFKVSGILELFSGLLVILFEVIVGGWLLFSSRTLT